MKTQRGYLFHITFIEGLKIPKNKTDYIIESNKILIDFAKNLKEISPKVVLFDWKKFDEDLSLNMYFDISIPKGYGVGRVGL